MTVSLPSRDPPHPHRFTVHDYHRMGEAGVFAPDARVELIEGEVIDMAPIGVRHAAVVNRLNEALVAAVRGAGVLSVQNPIRLDEHSEPQPDFAVLRLRADGYETALPGPSDVLLVIEVADSSLAHDRDRKFPLFARHGVPEAWLLDLKASRLMRYGEPGPDGYAVAELVEPLGLHAVPGLADRSVDLRGLFGGG